MTSRADKQILTTIREEFSAFSRLLKEEFKEFRQGVNEKLEEAFSTIRKLEEENKDLRNIVNRLEEKIDDGDAYERRDCVVFNGDALPVAENGENTVLVASELIKNTLKINIKPEEISTAHRMGKKPVNQAPDRRKVIIKLCRRDLKKDILFACKNIKPGFYANESLTPIRNTILFGLRNMRKDPTASAIVKGASSYDGRVFAWVKSTNSTRDTRISINTRVKFEEFACKYVQMPVDNFISHWPN